MLQIGIRKDPELFPGPGTFPGSGIIYFLSESGCPHYKGLISLTKLGKKGTSNYKNN